MPSKNGYTKPTTRNVAAICGLNFARSAIPPEIIAGMAAAKVSKKKNLTKPKPFLAANTSAPLKKLTP